MWRGQWRCEICARKWWAGERVGRRKRAEDNAKCGLLVSHLLHSCHLVMVVASLAGLRVLLLARVLVQVRVVFLLFVLFVDLVEPAPGPTPVTLGPTCYTRAATRTATSAAACAT